jgi:type I site-specific restriction-modification system R (restriction) subunit
LKAVTELSKAFALAAPREEALAIRDDMAFFQAVRAALAKRAPAEERPEEELDHAIRQIISRLKQIARELVETVRRNVTIDWAERENVRAHLRRLVKRVLRKYGYPPDKQEKATQTVLEQAEVLSEQWALAA